jgi:hypothetical protein
MKHILYLASAITLLSVAISCKPNEPAPVSAAVETAPISMHLHAYIGTSPSGEVDLYGTVHKDDEGRKISLSFAQLYISNIRLVKRDGSIYSLSDTILLSNIGEQVYQLGNVPIGNYRTIRFDIGLPAAVNAQIPFSATPVILNNSAMWFTGSAQANNYVFMHAAGKIDTTAAKNAEDADMAPFVYKIGTNSNVVQVSMPDQNFAVQPNTMAYIHMKADYAELFNGINLTNKDHLTVETAADNASSLVIDITSNMKKMFKYENQ